MNIGGGIVKGILALLSIPAVWVMGAMVIAGAAYRLPIVKGWVGEVLVNLWLKLRLNRDDYTIIPDVTVPDGEGGTTQIDHVVVSKYGVFVVETKNVSGWIFGNESDRMWTQKLHGGHSQRFQNPLRQNYKHTKVLADVLGVPHERLLSVVVFVGNTTFKTAMPPNVTYPMGCASFIRSRREPLFSDEDVGRMMTAIEESRLARGLKTRRDHVAYLREKHAEKVPTVPPSPGPAPTAVEPDSTVCPKCGSAMVQRTARRGANAGKHFLGCSAYPKCRYVLSPQ